MRTLEYHIFFKRKDIERKNILGTSDESSKSKFVPVDVITL